MFTKLSSIPVKDQINHQLDYTLPSGFKLKKRAVVLGGGIAGASISMILQNDINTTIVDTLPYFENKLAMYRAIVEPTIIPQNQSPHTRHAPKVEFVKGSVEEVTPEYIIVNGEKIHFDYLVLATGASYKPSFLYDTDYVINIGNGDNIARGYDKLVRAQNITIIGAGPSGIEVAAEICETFPEKKVALLSRSETILSRMSNEAQQIAYIHLTKFPNLSIHYNEWVQSIQQGRVQTNTTTYESDLSYICGGLKPNTNYLEKSMSNVICKDGVKVNKFLQVQGYDNIFAIGDVADTNEEKLAQNAFRHARIAARNIILKESGKDLEIYESEPRRIGVMLGRNNAMIVSGNSATQGQAIAKMKQAISLHVDTLPVFNKRNAM